MKKLLLIAVFVLCGCSQPRDLACVNLVPGDAVTVAGVQGIIVRSWDQNAEIALQGIGEVTLPCGRITPALLDAE